MTAHDVHHCDDDDDGGDGDGYGGGVAGITAKDKNLCE